MTLSAALNSATSSLRAIQTKMAVHSSNVANADDVHYSAKSVKQTANVANGEGIGVVLSGLESKVDANLVNSIVLATSADHAAQTNKDYLQALADVLGSLSNQGAGNALSTTLTSLASNLDKLATTPESYAVKNEVVTDLVDAAASMRTTSDDIQTLRANADSAIADAVAAANDALYTIKDLNDAIIRADLRGKSTADLVDQRNAALMELSSYINVSAYTDSNGAMNVQSGGQILVGAEVHELSFTATEPIHSTTVYPGGLSGISADGDDITGAIRSGTIASLIQLRDKTLPAVQTELNAVATKLRNTVNNIANSGSAYPPPNTLTGVDAYTMADPLPAPVAGTLRVAVTDADGKLVSSQDINLAAFTTVGDVVTALNAVGGLAASLTADGRLELKALSADNGVAIAGGSIGSESFSGFFGMNDVLTGVDATNVAVKPNLQSEPGRFPVGSLSTTAPLSLGDQAVSVGSSGLAQSLADALRSNKVSAAAADLVSNVSGQLSSAKSRATSTETSLNTLIGTFSSKYGVNVDEETAQMTELQTAYSASAHVLNVVKSMFEDLIQAVR